MKWFIKKELHPGTSRGSRIEVRVASKSPEGLRIFKRNYDPEEGKSGGVA